MLHAQDRERREELARDRMLAAAMCAQRDDALLN
jgi:hypothetical protein